MEAVAPFAKGLKAGDYLAPLSDVIVLGTGAHRLRSLVNRGLEFPEAIEIMRKGFWH